MIYFNPGIQEVILGLLQPHIHVLAIHVDLRVMEEILHNFRCLKIWGHDTKGVKSYTLKSPLTSYTLYTLFLTFRLI